MGRPMTDMDGQPYWAISISMIQILAAEVASYLFCHHLHNKQEAKL